MSRVYLTSLCPHGLTSSSARSAAPPKATAPPAALRREALSQRPALPPSVFTALCRCCTVLCCAALRQGGPVSAARVRGPPGAAAQPGARRGGDGPGGRGAADRSRGRCAGWVGLIVCLGSICPSFCLSIWLFWLCFCLLCDSLLPPSLGFEDNASGGWSCLSVLSDCLPGTDLEDASAADRSQGQCTGWVTLPACMSACLPAYAPHSLLLPSIGSRTECSLRLPACLSYSVVLPSIDLPCTSCAVSHLGGDTGRGHPTDQEAAMEFTNSSHVSPAAVSHSTVKLPVAAFHTRLERLAGEWRVGPPVLHGRLLCPISFPSTHSHVAESRPYQAHRIVLQPAKLHGGL